MARGSLMRACASALLGLPLLADALYQNGSVIAPCDSPIYCHGQLLHEIELARPFEDSKTFVDLPTIRPVSEVLEAFENLSKPLTNGTELHEFLSTYFGSAGSELEPVPQDQLTIDPTFLEHVNDTAVARFIKQVIEIWPELTRRYVGANTCQGCVSSFIPIDRPFVIAGGRFREPYYWDSFFIIEGLLRTKGSFTEISRNIIENFLDMVEAIGFVPNGARVYYRNRSQPPLLAQMVRVYIEYTNDAEILDRALPLLEREYEFWANNRSVTVDLDDRSYTLNHYAVINTQPRPESYREDYVTANNRSYYAESGIIYPETNELTDDEKAILYSELASGAESGWDYSVRWLRTPKDAVDDVYFPLRSVNTANIVPVDLNAILYHNEVTIAGFHNATGNATAARRWEELAANRSEAMTAVLWSDEHFIYFDYNLTSKEPNIFLPADENATPAETTLAGAPEGYQLAFSVAQFYPFWTGAAPARIKHNPLALRRAYSRIAAQLDRDAGAIPGTNLQSGEQWDEPSAWPPLQYILTQGLRNAVPTFGDSDPDYIWTQDLSLRLAQRYLDAAFCTWRASEQREGSGGEGVMFEKYASNATDVAGGGGEYEVVEGFGWSNGVLIWASDIFGDLLKGPNCGALEDEEAHQEKHRKVRRGAKPGSSLKLAKGDAKWVKKYK
ncbi:hypothetical protein V493_08015 [Pseudogymnoascus sp. VKM F-4281 (FW-2241)]|nr:hypothetical protein V493_08015 [Pseudogymnoascus sp. VKM F-4281 (FW-2241)]